MKAFQQTALNMIQKSSLQIALVIMSITAFTFGVMNIFLNLKDPIIIERGCDSRLAEVQSVSQTKDELENFIKIALSARFDSSLKNDPAIYLTEILQLARMKEQIELKSKSIDQRVIVRSIKLDQDKYFIQADRLISIGKVRTAVPLDLVVNVASKVRSLSNPYGLVLTFVDQIKEEDQNGNK